MIPSPRPYQREALDSIKNIYPFQHKLLIAHATGLGKGLFPIWITQEYPTHVRQHGLLFIAHRRKILFQAYKRYKKAFGDDLWIGLEMGEHEVTGQEDAIFMSIDSVGRVYQNRIRKYRKRDFGVIFTDESHHLSQQSKWDRVLNFFGVGSDEERERTIEVKGYECRPLAIHLTATPEDQMAPFVEEIAHQMSILQGIKRGWLTDIKSYQVQGANGIEGMVRAFGEYLTGQQSIIFASSVDESKRFTQALNDSGTAWTTHIDAETPKEKRRDMYDAFQAGVIRAMSNRLVMTEGVDLPEATAIFDNAPPSNQRVATQKWGRIVRPHPRANIDEYETAEGRREAIKNSPKPFATLVCTYDPAETGVSIVQTLSGRDIDVDADESLVVEEVIEVLEEYEEERPEVDLERVEEFDPDELRLRESDIFNRTIYHDRLKTITKLEWVTLNSEEMGIWMPRNPYTNRYEYKDCPTVLHLRLTEDGGVEKRIISGGWNGDFPAKIRCTAWQRTRYDNMREAMKKIDRMLWTNHKDIAKQITRGSRTEASQDLKEHLRNKDIAVSDDVTEEAARLLRANSRIRNKINKVDC